MLKILTIHGGPRKRQTYETTVEFLQELGNRTEIEVKDIFLFQEGLEFCRGCGTCILYGEEKCPIKDGFKEIHAKIQDSDAVIITTPVYSLQVTALVKLFVERSSYVLHRPCYYGKWFMSLSTQAISGDKEVEKYLTNIMHLWGFNIIPGLHVTIGEDENVIKKKIKDAVDLFQAIEKKAKFPVPTWKELMMFRARRSVMTCKSFAVDFPRDVEYFREKGWLKTPYCYDTHLNPLKRIAGWFFDALGRRIGRKIDEKQLQKVSQ